MFLQLVDDWSHLNGFWSRSNDTKDFHHIEDGEALIRQGEGRLTQFAQSAHRIHARWCFYRLKERERDRLQSPARLWAHAAGRQTRQSQELVRLPTWRLPGLLCANIG